MDGQKPLQEQYAVVIERFGQRPSFVTFEVNTDPKTSMFCRVSFYKATTAEASAEYLYATVDTSEARVFSEYLVGEGYERQPTGGDHQVRRASFSAPESAVVDILPLGVLIPRGSTS